MELFPVQVSSLAYQCMVGKRVSEEMNVFPCYSASENVAMLLLLFSEEFKGVGTELQGTAQVWEEPIFKGWLTSSPTKHKQKRNLEVCIKVSPPGLPGKLNDDARIFVI